VVVAVAEVARDLVCDGLPCYHGTLVNLGRLLRAEADLRSLGKSRPTAPSTPSREDHRDKVRWRPKIRVDIPQHPDLRTYQDLEVLHPAHPGLKAIEEDP